MLLSKASILSAPDLKTETINVPEWGGDITLKELSALDRERFYEANVKPDGGTDTFNYRAKLLVRMIVDYGGNRVFDDSDAEALGAKSVDVLTRLFDAASALNGVTEDAEKNSEPGQVGALPSASA